MIKDELKEIFREADAEGKDVAIELTVPTREDTEIIIVKHSNLEYKFEYYNENYTDDLRLIRFPEIVILGAKKILWEKEEIPEGREGKEE